MHEPSMAALVIDDDVAITARDGIVLSWLSSVVVDCHPRIRPLASRSCTITRSAHPWRHLLCSATGCRVWSDRTAADLRD